MHKIWKVLFFFEKKRDIPRVIQKLEFGKAGAKDLSQAIADAEAAPVLTQGRCRQAQSLGCRHSQNQLSNHEGYQWMVWSRLLALVMAMISSLFGMENMPDFQQLPKAELHLHLGGSFPKNYLLSIATPAQQEELTEALERIAQKVDYHAAFSVFRLVAEIVNSEEKTQNGVDQLCKSLIEDNVHYVEIRTGLKDLGQGAEKYLQAILSAIAANTSSRFQAKIVLSLRRDSSLDAVKQTVAFAGQYKDQGVVGIDISGNSTIGQIDAILPELMHAKKAGLDFIIHMGESHEEMDQMLLLTSLEPKRIGHGVHLTEEAKAWILHYQIPLEVCLTSSVLVKMIDEYHQHPGLEFFRSGHPIVFCTDDPLLFSTTLSQELFHAHRLCGLSIEEIQQIVKRSFDYSLERELQLYLNGIR